MITLFTNISKQYLDMLSADGKITCNCKQSQMYNESKQFSFAYDWIKSEFIKRTRAIELCNTDYFPVWTFYKYDGDNSNEHLDKYEDTAAQLTLQYCDEDVLLSDFDLWHCCLNTWFIASSEEADDEYEAFLNEHNINRHELLNDEYVNNNKYAVEARRMMLKSWNKIFDINNENQYLYTYNKDKTIQGNIKSIMKKDIVDIKFF